MLKSKEILMKNSKSMWCSFICVPLVVLNVAFLCFERKQGQYSSTIPNDTNINSQWAIEKVELDKAWDIYTGSATTKVGIVDSGIDATHEDLAQNVDTTLGAHFGNYNFSHLVDYVSHGTHVAGIVGAVGNNEIGISGACWDVDLVSLSIATNNNSTIYVPGIVDAVQYASSANTYIPILNVSSGATPDKIFDLGYNTIEILSSFSTYMSNYSGLLVCAAGNGNNFGAYTTQGQNIGNISNKLFPASYSQPNMIVVGNSDSNDQKASTSNYSSTAVDLFAPGQSIYSTIPNNNYASYSGTSMASPLVAGTAALLKSIDPSLSTSDIKAAILNNVDIISGLSNYCSTSGRLNAYRAALSILPEIIQNGDAVSFVSNINYQKFMKMNCLEGHYSLSIDMPSPYRVTIYKKYSGSPLVQQIFANGGLGTINFLSIQNQTLFVRVENLGNSNCNASVDLSYQSHSYTDHFVYYDASSHKSYCSCGNYVLMPHIIQAADPFSEYGVCSLCSAIIPIN